MRFAGYAAVFDRPDNGGDVVRAGAFLASLAKAKEVPLLWQHRPGAPIGRIEHLSEDKRGLRVIAALGGGETARRAEALLASRKLDGLSFGYRVRKKRGEGYLSGETLATSDWSVEPDAPGGVLIATSAFDMLVATVVVSGGTTGHIYRLTNHVTTTDGRDDSRSIMLRVEKR